MPTKTKESYQLDNLLKHSLYHFHNTVPKSKSGFDIKNAYNILSPVKKGFSKYFVPDICWPDIADAFLKDLVKDGFAEVLKKSKWNNNQPKPIAGAIARYEPVLNKVPHYFFPRAHAWDTHLIKETERGEHNIRRHMLELQDAAIKKGCYKGVPGPKDEPLENAGLVPILEYLAIHPIEAKKWVNKGNDICIIDKTLVITDLKKCKYISKSGRKAYMPGHGCLLIPFIAHDNRLVGHGIIVLDKEIKKNQTDLINDLVVFWNVLLESTISPIIANLNSAVLSSLDGFFLGRIRVIRSIIGGMNDYKKDEDSIQNDLLVLNKIAIYELIESKINNGESFRLVFFDLDEFKSVNDNLGHQYADVLLYHIAKELTDPDNKLFSPKEGRWLGRFGGDEFVGIIQTKNNPNFDVKDFSEGMANAISKNNGMYRKLFKKVRNKNKISKEERNKLRLSTSMGWVSNYSARADELKNAPGLSNNRKQMLKKMSEAPRLIELADTDTQTHVKRFGKNGYLEFRDRRKLSSSESQICKLHNIPGWLKQIEFFRPKDLRKPSLEIKISPEKYDSNNNK